MTLEEFMEGKADQLAGFNTFIQAHIPAGVQCGDWSNLFKVWCIMDKSLVAKEEMSKVMHSMVGGFWIP